jgi:hypothetical protein
MPWRTFRRVWITWINLMCLGLIVITFLEDYELSRLHDASERIGPLVCAAALLIGIVSEWLDWNRLAFIANVGFFAIVGIAVLGKAALMVITKPRMQYIPEAGLAIAIVGIPFTLVAVADFLLYWVVRPNVSNSRLAE